MCQFILWLWNPRNNLNALQLSEIDSFWLNWSSIWEFLNANPYVSKQSFISRFLWTSRLRNQTNILTWSHLIKPQDFVFQGQLLIWDGNDGFLCSLLVISFFDVYSFKDFYPQWMKHFYLAFMLHDSCLTFALQACTQDAVRQGKYISNGLKKWTFSSIVLRFSTLFWRSSVSKLLMQQTWMFNKLQVYPVLRFTSVSELPACVLETQSSLISSRDFAFVLVHMTSLDCLSARRTAYSIVLPWLSNSITYFCRNLPLQPYIVTTNVSFELK